MFYKFMKILNVKITLDNGENKELFYQFIPISHSSLVRYNYLINIYDFKVFMPELIDKYAVTIKGSLKRYVKNDIKFKYNLKKGKRIRIDRWSLSC